MTTKNITKPLRHNDNPQTRRLPNHTPRNPLQLQALQPRLRMLDLRNLIDVLECHGPNRPLRRIPIRWRTRARLALLSVVVVHRPWYIARAADLVLRGQDAGCGEEETGCWRGAEFEVEGAVGADGYTCGDRGAWVIVRGSRVKFLAEIHALNAFAAEGRSYGWGG